jgi:hypothetical protein
MKKLHLLGAMLVGASISTVALSYGGGQGKHRGGQKAPVVLHDLQPDCIEVERGVYKLKFYNKAITSYYREKLAVPVKKLLNQNCRLKQGALQNISSVAVKAKAYERTKLKLLTGNFTSMPEVMSPSYSHGAEKVIFDLYDGKSLGKLQVLVNGDIDLKAIIVDTKIKRKTNRRGDSQAPGGQRGQRGNRGRR